MEVDGENMEPTSSEGSSTGEKGEASTTASEDKAADEAELLHVLENPDGFSSLSPLPKMSNSLFKHPSEPGNKTILGCGMSDLRVDIAKFPPLPTPRHAMKRQESSVGIALVVFLSLAFIGMVHGIALTTIGGIEKHSATWWTFLGLVYAEVAMALICLMGLLLSDPGVVARSSENSFPIPLQCQAWIQAHADGNPESIEPLGEYYIASSETSNTPGDSYCVRCLVWRRFQHSTKYFHCSVCQRCVAEFDHHCSVFGRCIAGTWKKGNYKYFVTIIGVGSVGYLTSVVSLLWSLSLRYKPKIAVPVCLVVLWFATGVFMGKLCNGMCMWWRACAIGCTNQIRSYLKC